MRLHEKRRGTPVSRMIGAARVFWRGLRAWCGDTAYDRYLAAAKAHGFAERALSRQEFYAEQVQRRFSRPNRCC